MRRRYLDTLLLGFENQAERVIREAIEAGVPEGVIDAEVIAPGMRVIGDLWEAGAITVADEHLATQIATRVIALQREAFRAARRRADPASCCSASRASSTPWVCRWRGASSPMPATAS